MPAGECLLALTGHDSYIKVYTRLESPCWIAGSLLDCRHSVKWEGGRFVNPQLNRVSLTGGQSCLGPGPTSPSHVQRARGGVRRPPAPVSGTISLNRTPAAEKDRIESGPQAAALGRQLVPGLCILSVVAQGLHQRFTADSRQASPANHG